MTDLYIATPTQADYDALMRLAEAAGYEWLSGKKPTALNLYKEYVKDGGQVIRFIVEHKELMQCEREYFEKEGQAIETIPNLATIKSIRKVTRDNRMPFIAAKWLPEHYKSAKAIYVIQAGDSTTYTNEGDDFIAALAVDYKPEEGWVMPEKVKLPKFMCDWLDEKRLSGYYPIASIANWSNSREGNAEVNGWLFRNEANQWKLIDALRNGYEAEPEQLYYVDFGKAFGENRYLNKYDKRDYYGLANKNEPTDYKTRYTMPEILAIDPRYKAFAVKVEEVDNDD